MSSLACFGNVGSYASPSLVNDTGIWFPCALPTDDTPYPPCCVQGDVCLSNNYCKFTHPSHYGTGFYLAGSTDANWRAPSATDHCIGHPNSPDVSYNGNTDQWACCLQDSGTEGPSDCRNLSSTTWSDPNPSALSTIGTPILNMATAVPPTSSSTASSTASTTSSASPSETSSSTSDSSSSGLSSGAAAGIGVGVAVAVIAVVGLVAFFLLRRLRAQKATPNGDFTNSQSPAGPSLPVYSDHAGNQYHYDKTTADTGYGGYYPQQPMQQYTPTHEVSGVSNANKPVEVADTSNFARELPGDTIGK